MNGLASGRLELMFVETKNGGEILQSLTITNPEGSGALVTLSHRHYIATPLSGYVQAVLRVMRGEMDGDSFYTSAIAAGIDDQLVPEIASALAFDFDFAREIHKGDVFEIVVAATVNRQGNAVGKERLVFVQFATPAKSRALYRFAAKTGTDEWFDGDGRSVRRALMRTPVEGARVSSYYGMRMHPVLGFMRMHKGIDFATPVGTPVYAAGDGTIAAEGTRSGYGLYLRIAHNATLATAYAHLSRFPDGLALGVQVHQGQVVAFTGNSGELSTGPHLHYEVLVNGVQVDPLSIATAEGKSLAGPELPLFRAERDRIDELRQKSL